MSNLISGKVINLLIKIIWGQGPREYPLSKNYSLESVAITVPERLLPCVSNSQFQNSFRLTPTSIWFTSIRAIAFFK